MVDIFVELYDWLDPDYEGQALHMDVSQISWVHNMARKDEPGFVCSLMPTLEFRCKTLVDARMAAGHLAKLADTARTGKAGAVHKDQMEGETDPEWALDMMAYLISRLSHDLNVQLTEINQAVSECCEHLIDLEILHTGTPSGWSPQQEEAYRQRIKDRYG